MARNNFTYVLPVTASITTPWIDTRSYARVSLHTYIPTNTGTPIGVVTMEYSNDVEGVKQDMALNPAFGTSNAKPVNVTSSLQVLGTAWSNGYNGSANRASFVGIDPADGLPAFMRVVYTRTSGGTGNVFTVAVSAR